MSGKGIVGTRIALAGTNGVLCFHNCSYPIFVSLMKLSLFIILLQFYEIVETIFK